MLANYRSTIKATGSYLPKKIITNAELSKTVDTNDEWITSRTGIKQRHIVEDNEYTSHMCIKAAKAALERSGLTPNDIDLVIVGTTTPDSTFPATAVKVQAALGIPACPAFDLQAVCAGFVYIMSVADSLIHTGKARNALLIGADSMSKILDWQDRGTCVLFGDGAGAVVLSKEEKTESGIISSLLCADGNLESILYANGGVSSTQEAGVVKMTGREVFRHAVEKMVDAMEKVLIKSNLAAEDVDWVIPHQANLRIIEAIEKKMNIPTEKIAVTLDQHANTSAASIPLALDKYISDGKIKKGDLVLMTALGGGLAWGALLVRI